MELIFQLIGGGDAGTYQFTMEVSYSDSVPQIKRKIQQLTGIPTFRQTLRFNGAILTHDIDLRHSQIVSGSTIRIHLLQHIAEDFVPSHQEMESMFALLSPPSSDQTPIANTPIFRENIPHRFPTHANISDQSGDQTDTGTGNQPPTTIHQRSPIGGGKRAREESSGTPAVEQSAAAAAAGGCKRQHTVHDWVRCRDIRTTRRRPKLIVMVVYGVHRCMVEVWPEDLVSVLREQLVRIGFILPQGVYLFIHRHRIMDEDKSFEANQVEQGDYIQPFPANLIP